jgi:hypothetical protein
MASAKEKTLAQLMKKKGATGVPNEQTYIATAQEQAMAGQQKAANETMQYSVKNPASKDIEAQDEATMRENDPKTAKKYKAYLKALKNAKSKGK